MDDMDDMDELPASRPIGNKHDWLVGGGEMGQLIRSMDWTKTPLGPRETWPQSLRTTVSLCLASNFPIAIAWGPERTQIYNDGYWPICGAKHPSSMGQDFRECWFSAWPAIGEAFEQAVSGRTAFLENQPMFLDRNGYLEETFFTFSFSPISDESGAVGGLFHPVTELTQQALAARRLQVLRTLATATAEARTVDEAGQSVVGTLASDAWDLPFALIYLLDTDLKLARLAGATGLVAGTPACPSVIDLRGRDDKSWPLAHALGSAQNEEINQLEQRFGPITCGPYAEPIQTAMTLPIRLSGADQPIAVLLAGVSTRRALDDAYRTFYELLRDGVTSTLYKARAYELERERAEALAEIDRAKTEFFSNVSHEFRTPLTLMLGPLEAALSDSRRTLSPSDRERVDTAHRNALRLLKQVNSLLDFSRIEAGRVQAAYLPIELATFTAELASMFRSAFETAGLGFVVDCLPLPEPVYVDPGMWEKIVLNLISNALKFTFEGQVVVRLRWHPAGAVLTVSDSGVGVPPEHLSRLFERFHRVPNARSRTFEGSGIGLALVNELVKLHGGTISVDSAVDRGTTFTVTMPRGTAHLPADRIGEAAMPAPAATEAQAFVEEALHWLPDHLLAAPAARGASALSTAPFAGASKRSGRVLLVDDNADMRRYLHGLLSPYWQVEAAADGLQALDAVQRELPDLVLTDVMMPKLDGFGLLRALRADPRTHALPVIMLSARAGEEARVEGLDAGADDYMVKPFSGRELLARVRTHVEIARLREQAVQMAQHDPLTGLPNRGLSREFADHLLAAARRSGAQVALLFIDMDRFKPINDTYGHEVGDKVLMEVARRLQASVRGEDTVGRLGGDEFLAVLAHTHGASDAAHAARQLISSLGRPYHIDGLELHTSPSIGISLFPDDGTDVETLLRTADAAMYQAKQSGRNNFRFYRGKLNESAGVAVRAEGRLREGLERGEFELHYQPIVDLATGGVVGAEALMRWPATGIGPSNFIPVAEESGLIEPLGAWVIRETCGQARQWQARGLSGLTLSINVSLLQLRQASLYEALARSIAEHGIDPAGVQIEITETGLPADLGEAISTLQAIRGLGVRIALDHFGKGSASLRDLGRLPLDTIKVDQTFLRHVDSDPGSMAVVDAIVAAGKTLRLQVVAEGIESAEAVTSLRGKDSLRMQGNYLCPPVAAGAFEHWHHAWLAQRH